jgi:hypothetical protein
MHVSGNTRLLPLHIHYICYYWLKFIFYYLLCSEKFWSYLINVICNRSPFKGFETEYADMEIRLYYYVLIWCTFHKQRNITVNLWIISSWKKWFLTTIKNPLLQVKKTHLYENVCLKFLLVTLVIWEDKSFLVLVFVKFVTKIRISFINTANCKLL